MNQLHWLVSDFKNLKGYRGEIGSMALEEGKMRRKKKEKCGGNSGSILLLKESVCIVEHQELEY